MSMTVTPASVLRSKMEKPPMCRICLVDNVRMYIVVNKNLHELYEKLTGIPFVTEDSRPILACFICCTKLKQCYQLLRKCMESEEQFSKMMNEDYEPNPLISQGRLEFYSGFITSQIVHVHIVDEYQTESIDIKEELPAVYEGIDDNFELKEEHQSNELKLENVDNCCLDVAQHSESDLEDDVLMEFKIKVEAEEVSKKKRARETKSGTVAKKQKLNTRRTKLEDEIPPKQTTNVKSDSELIRKSQNCTSKRGTYFKEPYKCDQRSCNRVKNKIQHTRTQICEKPYKCDVCQRCYYLKKHLTRHIRIHTGEKPHKCDVCQRSFSQKYALTKHIRIHTGEKPYKCDVCQCSFNQKGHLTNHIRKHTGEKPYKCDVCQRSFSQKGHLTNHIRKHTGEKPYKCDVCQSSFSRHSVLTNHIRIHTGEKPYKCDVCQSSFSRLSVITKHFRIHTGDKHYKCNVCQSSFSQHSELTKHIRIHTGEKN